jgi:glycosyltransferase involved in cell wall biosynthesis
VEGISGRGSSLIQARLQSVGVVAIGRNEGERLCRCIESLPARLGGVVYVDSASTDDSVEQARRRGAEIVALDMSIPFTAARARNVGLRRLRERWPAVTYVQFIDGDCTLSPGWLDSALREIEGDARLAVVCGRRRERFPESSVYNRLCDMEWNTPVGETDCGGDALARVEALMVVGGYDERLIAGEEPELCVRLRGQGWSIRRINEEMTLHDAALTRFRQWWKRTVRSGHAYAEVNSMHPNVWRREKRSALVWGLLLPGITCVSAIFTGGVGLALLAAYPVLWLRVLRGQRARGYPSRDAALYASYCVIGKSAEVTGMVRYWWNRGRGRRSRLIEYK